MEGCPFCDRIATDDAVVLRPLATTNDVVCEQHGLAQGVHALPHR